MICLRVIALILGALFCAALAGCGDRPPLTHPAPSVEGPYRLDTGDKIRVTVYDQTGLTNVYEVDQAGFVNIPLAGRIEARGSTTEQVAGRISAKLGATYLRNPNVTAEVTTYRPIFVLGEVGNPGQYTYVPGMTAETAAAVAGGFTDRANKRLVRVSRTLGGKLVEGRIAVTEPIRPGDTVDVYEALF
jgi:polysaccharide export outer membrane protein